jgi:hypothetical protein
MARIIFPADNVGEAKAYIAALTGVKNIAIPAAPAPNQLGQILKVESKFISVSASAEIGFGYASMSASTEARILLQDYWFSKEIDGTVPEVNSWTFAVGFRVGLCSIGAKADLNVGIGVLAAKAQMEGLNVRLQVLRVGMPGGPNVPVDLAVPVTLDVEKFGELKAWEGSVLQYVEEHRSDLAPVLVSASVNISGEKLLTEAPGVRYALRRIVARQSLKQALALLAAGKAPEVGDGETRTIYSAIFHDTTMLIPGQPSEGRAPSDAEVKAAKDWLLRYQKI